MTRDEWRRIKDIVTGALAEPAASRPAYLDSRCGSDPALRGEVESLLESVTTAADLFEAPSVLIDDGRPAPESRWRTSAGRSPARDARRPK
jgi:hypothetical protein